MRAGELAGRSDDPAATTRIPGLATGADAVASPPRSRTGDAAVAPGRPGPGHPSYPIEDDAAGAGPAPYVTIVLPCYNEGAHVLQEIERITAAMSASELTYEVLCIDDASTDDTLDVLRHAQRTLPAPADPAVPPQRRLRHGPPDRHPAGPRRDRRVDRRRHDLRERAHPRARAHPARRRHLRPGRRRPHHRGGHPQVGPGAGEVADPQDRRVADQVEDPRPQLRPARLPPRRVACPTCGCCRPGSRASRRSPSRSSATSTTSSTSRRATPSGPASASSTSSTTPTATSSRCCAWSCTSTRSRCSCRRRCG